jgi:large subunit ribosomal protein L35Ae
MLIRVDGIDSRDKAQKLIGKKVTWKSKKVTITGKVSVAHGGKGVVRAIFEKGMPGQALATEVSIE